VAGTRTITAAAYRWNLRRSPTPRAPSLTALVVDRSAVVMVMVSQLILSPSGAVRRDRRSQRNRVCTLPGIRGRETLCDTAPSGERERNAC
jgi:hypothetical protein